ncbi:aldehyde dehydrogenase family protein [Prolixibacteraceae bacterium JC049]|nr:aldehyde dehydrogenase family protein [Prolixibacteraceae bacterium JC049]
MQKYPIYVGGKMVETSIPLEVSNPFTEKVFAQTYLADDNDLELAIAKAQEVEQEMKHMPAWKRSEILLFIADELTKEKQRIAEILACEAAKPIKYALGEMDRAIQTFIVAAEEAKRLPGEHLSIDWTPAGTGREGWVKYFPVGLVAGIAPFNFPLNLAVHKIAPAIAAGCPMILKPASSTPLATLELAKIIDRSELPKGALSILPMKRDVGNKLVTDERFKLLTFTGSPEVGWKMKNDAGKKKVVLELGGNAGLVVSDSCDLQEAVNRAVIGAFAYAGQVCIHTQRIYIQDTIFDEFVEMFVEKTEQLKAGNPLSEGTDITAMIDEWNAQRVEQWVTEAVKQGAQLLTGGVREGTYMSPTVLTNTNSDMKVCACEVFGPVVTLEKYDEFEDVIEEVNNSRYGLQAGVFTDRISEMNMAFDRLDVGGVIINDVPTFRVDHMPYGGVKDSGLGREGVKYAMHDMLEPKILVKNSY